MGNASEIDPAKIEGDFARVLAGGERIEKAVPADPGPLRLHEQAPDPGRQARA
jgi:hypothetical protein